MSHAAESSVVFFPSAYLNYITITLAIYFTKCPQLENVS
jgi:hypothetical protein